MANRRAFLVSAAAMGIACLLPKKLGASSHSCTGAENRSLSTESTLLLSPRSGLSVGMLVSREILGDQTRLATALPCDQFVMADQLDWGVVRSTAQSFDYRSCDQFAAVAEKHRVGLIGRPLVQGQRLPEWVHHLDEHTCREEILGHINNVVQHLAPQIGSWNLLEDVLWPNAHRPGRTLGEFPCVWDEVLVRQAFETAHQVDPVASLFWSESGIQEEGGESELKRNEWLYWVGRLSRLGAPIAGIEVQLELNSATLRAGVGPRLSQFVRTVRRMGLELRFREIYPVGAGPAATNPELYLSYLQPLLECGKMCTFIRRPLALLPDINADVIPDHSGLPESSRLPVALSTAT